MQAIKNQGLQSTCTVGAFDAICKAINGYATRVLGNSWPAVLVFSGLETCGGE